MTNPFDGIRECWRGTDLPSNDEICAAIERYQIECEGKFRADFGPYTVGRLIGYAEGLAIVVATTSRDCWAHLFKRPVVEWKC